MLGYLLIAGASALGALAGWIISRRLSRRIVAHAEEQAARQMEQAGQAAALRVREMEARAREEVLRERDESVVLERQAADENGRLEERIHKLETRLEARGKEAAARTEQQSARQVELEQRLESAKAERQVAAQKHEACRSSLDEKAGETASQIKERLTEALVEETRAQCADRLRNFESTSNEDFMRQAKRTMGIAIGRYGGHFMTERLTSTFPLSVEAAAKLAGHAEDLRTMEDLTGVRFALADSNDSLRFESGDGAGRELARRVLTRFLAEEKVRDLSRLFKSVSADFDREIVETGQEAFRVLELELAHPEIVRLVGRLNFRTSYGQNQWRHAIESSLLAGAMAAELGLDVKVARRGTLLHDIGKALTHELEGSHASIGAEWARKYGEDEIIANAVGSHHGDEPPKSPYAYVVAAADAMSGARPGARRETVETYVERISDLERIASQFSGVVTVHAVQAGRELRIHVDEQRVNDVRAGKLSEEIAKRISDTLAFPGQIRVTVIREFKAIEIAN